MAKDVVAAMVYILDDGLAGNKKSKRTLKRRIRRQVKRHERQLWRKSIDWQK